jgi:hypothetical protein
MQGFQIMAIRQFHEVAEVRFDRTQDRSVERPLVGGGRSRRNSRCDEGGQ